MERRGYLGEHGASTKKQGSLQTLCVGTMYVWDVGGVMLRGGGLPGTPKAAYVMRMPAMCEGAGLQSSADRPAGCGNARPAQAGSAFGNQRGYAGKMAPRA